MELSAGNRGQDDSNTIPDGGSLPNGQVAQTVQLDEIFRTFDPVTRLAFQTWMQDQGVALLGRGQDLNDAHRQPDAVRREHRTRCWRS